MGFSIKMCSCVHRKGFDILMVSSASSATAFMGSSKLPLCGTNHPFCSQVNGISMHLSRIHVSLCVMMNRTCQAFYVEGSWGCVIYFALRWTTIVKLVRFIFASLNSFSVLLKSLVKSPRTPRKAQIFDIKRSREWVGSLLYIGSGTCPYIWVSISELSKYLEAPTQAHMKAEIRVLRYLKGTSNVGIGILYKRGNFSDFASMPIGVEIRLHAVPHRQLTFSLSSAESKYMSLSLAVQETLWLCHLLEELGFRYQPATVIKMDKKASIAMAELVGYQSRVKHIYLRYHFDRDAVNDGVRSLEYVQSTQQLADFMTKALQNPLFAKLVQAAGIFDKSQMSQ
ncbi:hypothetical protein PsorP6_016599 [Peronosclerospora sorghi]|uniref:Uncharacterized protein n=1 Tax=Peronosclerospora sorghi TaxID=230839 RepID=A0ACC0VN08_9STRA|nr:hypothetical protein PsorP6_016599 [Peronosclerospora sorghi]